jgi:Ni/Fe-hydrogenase 1 B-type cytochrome subunit
MSAPPVRVRDGVPKEGAIPHPRTGRRYRWVHLWHLPIRLMHWVAAISIVGLFWTGLYLGRPYFMGALSGGFVVQYARLVHFIFAGALVATIVVRVYWLFVGNKYERWRALFPVSKRDWKHMWMMVRYYLLIHPERAPRYLGHNPLQQMLYTLTYLVTAVMILTGFLLYAQAQPRGWMYAAIGWITPLLGGNQMVRLIHHVLPWYYPFFVIIHIYIVVRTDSIERTGTVSSMIAGGRFVPVDEHHVDE